MKYGWYLGEYNNENVNENYSITDVQMFQLTNWRFPNIYNRIFFTKLYK